MTLVLCHAPTDPGECLAQWRRRTVASRIQLHCGPELRPGCAVCPCQQSGRHAGVHEFRHVCTCASTLLQEWNFLAPADLSAAYNQAVALAAASDIAILVMGEDNSQVGEGSPRAHKYYWLNK